MNTFEDSILQVLKGDALIGAAFLVSDRLVATCAHVVESAGAKVGRNISLRLSGGEVIEAIIEPEFWCDSNAEDISILRLAKPIESIQPLILGSSSGTKGHGFSTFGFPKDGQELSGGGEIIGQAAVGGIKFLQLDSRHVTPGFSGAPIFDEITKRVVGMVVAITPPDEYQRLGTTAFAIPSETIRKICPELQISDICPYRSLDVFNEEDAPFFFGRERVIQKMVDSLKREPRFLAVLGPSGSGKSSVVRAGLIPALKQGKVPGSDKWGVLTIRPANQPFEQLDNVGLSKSQDGIESAIRSWLEVHSEKTRLVLVIDQFEEVLVSTPENIRQILIKDLAYSLGSSVAITVILTLRDDFYSRFLQDASVLATWLERGLANIPTTLDKDELKAMIFEPAKTVGLNFEEGLVDVIVSDAIEADRTKEKARSTILPLLEFALTQLWEKCQDGRLTHESYNLLGGVTGGLTQWADRTYYSLDVTDQRIAQQLLTELIHLGDVDQNLPDNRRTVFLDELRLVTKQKVDVSRVIQILADARLLITGRNPHGEFVELIHDALIQQWELLRFWLIENRQFLTWRQKLQVNRRDWITGKGDVLRGSALDEAKKWIQDYGDQLNANERKYIDASVLAKSEYEKSLKRARIQFLVPFMVIVLTVGIVGVYTVTRLLSNSINERLTNQLLEAARSVSDQIARVEIRHVEAARIIAFTRGLGDAIDIGDYEQIAALAQPAMGGLNVENLLVFDREGQKRLQLIKNPDGTSVEIGPLDGIDTLSIVGELLAENNPNSLSHRQIELDPGDGRYYYFTTIPVVKGDRVVGVAVVGTSLISLIPEFKRTSLADVIIYAENGQAISSSLTIGSSETLSLRTISISPELYRETITQDNIVQGDNFEIDGRWYQLVRAPFKVADDRIGVFAVILPLDFVIETNSASRTTYTLIFFLAIVVLTLIGSFISRLAIRSLDSSI